jgi:hypothetical protein
LTFDDFQPLLRQGFALNYPGHAEVLTLTEVRLGRTGALPGLPPSFSLLFEGESRVTMLGQSTYRLENATLGSLEVFLVPVGRLPAGNFRYEAVFG